VKVNKKGKYMQQKRKQVTRSKRNQVIMETNTRTIYRSKYTKIVAFKSHTTGAQM